MRLAVSLPGGFDLGLARQADELGLWAVEVRGETGVEMVNAARIAQATQHVRIVVNVSLEDVHPFALAEELSVLDNLSAGRVLVVVASGADLETVQSLREILIGRASNGAMLAPPTVQTELPVWTVDNLGANTTELASSPESVRDLPGQPTPGRQELTGKLEEDRPVIEQWKSVGCTHLLVTWPGDLTVLARHLATRAATTVFPQSVADMADEFL